MSKDTYMTEITLTVPAGRFCRDKRKWCRFHLEQWNHPASYCFLIPESGWEHYEAPRKHPKCPSLTQLPKPMRGEGLSVMNRLAQFKTLMDESPGEP